MSPSGKISEAMVKSYKDAFGDYFAKVTSGLVIPPTPDIGWHATRYALEAVMSALSSSPVGEMVLVPREPTPEMLRAAIDAIPMDKYIDIGARRSNVTLSTDECATIYRTMIAASSGGGR